MTELNTATIPNDTVTYTRPPGQRLRLGFLTRLETGADAADSYRVGLDIFQLAEELGFDCGWIAQHHFLNGDGRLPSAFPFLAAAAERTKRIQLGTAIVILPLEDPLRVAEDAAFVDTISGGRLQLGLGTGGDPLSFNAFGKDVEARREAYAEGYRVIQEALIGTPVNGTEAVMYPTAPTLVDRLWEATFSPQGATKIGQHGNGLLVARNAALSHQPADVAQIPLANAYFHEMRAHAHPPRLGLSRTVYAAADRKTAMADLESGISGWIEAMVKRGDYAPGLTRDEYYAKIHVHCGHPEEVIQSVRDDQLYSCAAELICQAQPGHPTAKQIMRSLELIATQVAPELGWTPARG